ncbi:hypothetical protein Scep_007154 [Stephania cephalantha]|uniref:Uncharacterized protein n=1 Tax=Stephania cephalantha TaxID=152367 RepID=A0AAP0KBW5_9MAGN
MNNCNGILDCRASGHWSSPSAMLGHQSVELGFYGIPLKPVGCLNTNLLKPSHK